MTRVDDLPKSMIELAETLGLRIALLLIQHFGGQDVKWPAHPRDDHAVIRALGETDGRAVCQYLGGGSFYIPHARRARSIRADVLKLEQRGMDRNAIARALGVSQRHVRRMANRTDDSRQSRMNFE